MAFGNLAASTVRLPGAPSRAPSLKGFRPLGPQQRLSGPVHIPGAQPVGGYLGTRLGPVGAHGFPTGSFTLPTGNGNGPHFRIGPIQQRPGAFGAPSPLLPGAPGGSGTPPAGDTPLPPDPRDATYFNNVQGNDKSTADRINALNLEGGNAGTTLQSTLDNLNHQQPLDQLKLMEGANRSGGLYSAGYGQQQGGIVDSYRGRTDAANSNYANTMGRLQAQIAGLKDDQGTYDTGQYLDAVGRQTAATATDPAVAAIQGLTQALSQSPTTPAATPTTTPAAGAGGRGGTRGRVNISGRRNGVPVVRRTAVQPPSRTNGRR